MTSENFIDWLLELLKERDWSMNELARRADISSGAISLIMSEQRNPGPDVLLGIARALHLPPAFVFWKAGLLPENPDPDKPLSLVQLNYLFAQLPTYEQDAILALVQRLVDERAQIAHGRLAASEGEPG